jgi:hypothetical protein
MADVLTHPTLARHDAPLHKQGRSERRGEAYSALYVEPLSDARTPLADVFSILLHLHTRHIMIHVRHIHTSH